MGGRRSCGAALGLGGSLALPSYQTPGGGCRQVGRSNGGRIVPSLERFDAALAAFIQDAPWLARGEFHHQPRKRETNPKMPRVSPQRIFTTALSQRGRNKVSPPPGKPGGICETVGAQG